MPQGVSNPTPANSVGEGLSGGEGISTPGTSTAGQPIGLLLILTKAS
jgi:hypothetical protein